jgi:ABC-type Fe3+-hydroxamate transport system substrate-binding protein
MYNTFNQHFPSPDCAACSGIGVRHHRNPQYINFNLTNKKRKGKMKRLFLFSILFILLLTTCGQLKGKADVPGTTEAKATQVIVDQYIKANETYNADLLISLLHDDYTFMDYGLGDGPWGKDDISFYIQESMAEPDSFQVKIDTYVITPDGRFAVLQGTYSQAATLTGKRETAPAYAVLEFKDGKIVAETWYYNGEVFH